MTLEVTLIDAIFELLTVDMSVGVLIIVFNVAVDLLMDGLTAIVLDGLTNSDAGVLVGVNIDISPGVMTGFEIAMPAAFDSRPMAALDCDSVLQVWMPSYHV